MSARFIRVGAAQLSVLGTYVFESVHDEDAERRPAGLILDGSYLVVECSADVACSALTDAANSADDSGDTSARETLTALARRVRRSFS